MLGLILLSVLVLCFVMLTVLTYYLHALEKEYRRMMMRASTWKQRKKRSHPQAFTYTALVLVSIGMAASFYIYVQGTPGKRTLMEWLNIVVRLMHIIVRHRLDRRFVLFCFPRERPPTPDKGRPG